MRVCVFVSKSPQKSKCPRPKTREHTAVHSRRRAGNSGDEPSQPPGDWWLGTQGGGKLGLAGSRQAGRIREAIHPLSPVAGVTSPERDRPLSLYFAVFTDLLHGDPGPGSRSPPPPDPGGCWASEDSCRFWNVPRGSVDPWVLPLRGGLCTWQTDALPWADVLISDFPFLN